MKASRSNIISTTKLILTEELPILRLKQLCKQGHYRYRMIWDHFANGYMITCEIFYFVGGTRYTLAKEVQWVETQNLHTAQNTVVAVLLHRLDLGIEPDDADETPPTNVSELTPQKAMKWGADMMNILLNPKSDETNDVPTVVHDVMKLFSTTETDSSVVGKK